jgi:hypothetical protein
VQKIHEAANGSGLNAEQRRDGLPFLGAVVTRQRARIAGSEEIFLKAHDLRPIFSDGE